MLQRVMKNTFLLWIVCGLAIVTSGCSKSAGEIAEREYEMVDAAQPKTIAGDYARCAASQRVEQAYLSDQNTKEYSKWRLFTSITCQNVRLRDQIGVS